MRGGKQVNIPVNPNTFKVAETLPLCPPPLCTTLIIMINVFRMKMHERQYVAYTITILRITVTLNAYKNLFAHEAFVHTYVVFLCASGLPPGCLRGLRAWLQLGTRHFEPFS